MATLITVTGTYLNPDGTAAVGQVTFTLNEPIANGTSIYHVAAQVVKLNGSGHISQSLVANDDTATTPTGTYYIVTEEINGASPREYNIVVSHSAQNGTVDLSTLMPNTAPGIG